MTSKRLAGIDIGTLTCRLLIADLPANNRLNAGFSDWAMASINRND